MNKGGGKPLLLLLLVLLLLLLLVVLLLLLYRVEGLLSVPVNTYLQATVNLLWSSKNLMILFGAPYSDR